MTDVPPGIGADAATSPLLGVLGRMRLEFVPTQPGEGAAPARQAAYQPASQAAYQISSVPASQPATSVRRGRRLPVWQPATSARPGWRWCTCCWLGEGVRPRCQPCDRPPWPPFPHYCTA